MNDDQLEDLKQFIDTRLSQSEARFDGKLDQLRVELRTEMHDGFAGVAEALEDINVRLDDSHTKLGRRLTKLEQQATTA